MRIPHALAIALCGLAALPVAAGEYTVSPMRMELDRDTRSSVITLANVGKDRIDFQLKAMEWTQDAEGKDRYSETTELVFFPKILSVEPKEERVVRVGIKTIPVATERTFRVFIEKIPAPNPEPPPPGAHIAVNVRFALPIFVKPAAPQAKGEIVNATLSKGAFALVLKNAGNEHFRMDGGIVLSGRNAQGKEVFAQTIDDHYLLAGTTKRYTQAVPAEACTQIATLEVTAKAEQFVLSRKLDVDRASCK